MSEWEKNLFVRGFLSYWGSRDVSIFFRLVPLDLLSEIRLDSTETTSPASCLVWFERDIVDSRVQFLKKMCAIYFNAPLKIRPWTISEHQPDSRSNLAVLVAHPIHSDSFCPAPFSSFCPQIWVLASESEQQRVHHVSFTSASLCSLHRPRPLIAG